MDLESVIDELYGLDPSQFTARRDALSVQARDEGNRDLASAIKALRRPSAAAYTVNLMARVRGDEMARLVELGERMRQVQAALSGGDLRALGRQRQQLVAGLAQEARREAAAAGHPISQATGREVESTFEAALADEAAGRMVLAGRLIRALERSGMDPVYLEGAVAGPATSTARAAPVTREPAGGPADAPPAGEVHQIAEQRARRKARLEEEAARAQEAAGTAERRLSEAAATAEAAVQNLQAAEEAVASLEEQLASARRDADRAATAERGARRDAVAAQDEAEAARSRAERAREAADAFDA